MMNNTVRVKSQFQVLPAQRNEVEVQWSHLHPTLLFCTGTSSPEMPCGLPFHVTSLCQCWLASSAGVRQGFTFSFLSVQITVHSTKRIRRESEYALLARSFLLRDDTVPLRNNLLGKNHTLAREHANFSK